MLNLGSCSTPTLREVADEIHANVSGHQMLISFEADVGASLATHIQTRLNLKNMSFEFFLNFYKTSRFYVSSCLTGISSEPPTSSKLDQPSTASLKDTSIGLWVRNEEDPDLKRTKEIQNRIEIYNIEMRNYDLVKTLEDLKIEILLLMKCGKFKERRRRRARHLQRQLRRKWSLLRILPLLWRNGTAFRRSRFQAYGIHRKPSSWPCEGQWRCGRHSLSLFVTNVNMSESADRDLDTSHDNLW